MAQLTKDAFQVAYDEVKNGLQQRIENALNEFTKNYPNMSQGTGFLHQSLQSSKSIEEIMIVQKRLEILQNINKEFGRIIDLAPKDADARHKLLHAMWAETKIGHRHTSFR